MHSGKSENLTREELMRVAARLFQHKGFRGTSMQDISTVLGIQKSSIYHYITGKEDLLREITRTTMNLLIRAGEEAALSALEPEEKLRRLIRAHVRLTCEHLDLFTVTLRELTPSNAASFWEEAVEARDRYESLLRGILEAGVAGGIFRNAPIPLAGFALLGMVNWLIRWYKPEGSRNPGEIADILLDIFLNGLQIRNHAFGTRKDVT